MPTQPWLDPGKCFKIREPETGKFWSEHGFVYSEQAKLYHKIGHARNAIAYHGLTNCQILEYQLVRVASHAATGTASNAREA